jgi:hypothetical protein
LVILNLDQTRGVLIRKVEKQGILLSVVASSSLGGSICDAESVACADRIEARGRRILKSVCRATLEALVERCSDYRIAEVDA